MKAKQYSINRILFFLFLLAYFSIGEAARSAAYVHFYAPVSVTRILPSENFPDIRDAVVKGLMDSERFSAITLLTDSLSEDLSHDDFIAIRDSLSQKDAVLVSVVISDLIINENILKDGQIDYDASLSLILKFFDPKDWNVIHSERCRWPKAVNGLTGNISKVINNSSAQAIKNLASSMSRDVKKVSMNAIRDTASIFEFVSDKKDDIKEMHILIDPGEKLSKGDKVDIRANRSIAGKSYKKLIAAGKIVRIQNDSVAVCEIINGSANIKESLSKNEKISIQVR